MQEHLGSLLTSLLQVRQTEGQVLSMLDANLHPYYEKLFFVSRNEDVFRAIAVIAEHNPEAFTEEHKLQLQRLRGASLDAITTSRDTHVDATYSTNPQNEQEADTIRLDICTQVENLFRQ